MLSKWRSISGVSLAELIVSTALMAGLTLLAWELMAAGSRHLKDSRNQLDLQRDTLLALSWMSKDLSESSLIAVHANPWGAPPVPPTPPVAGPPRGVVFASPRDANGEISFSGNTVNWNSRICYYVDLVNEGKLYRAIAPHPAEVLPRLIDPSTEDTSFFQANITTLPHRLLARNISYLNVERQSSGVELSAEVATPDRRFTVLVTTLVKPRN